MHNGYKQNVKVQGGGKPRPYPTRTCEAYPSRVGAGLAPALLIIAPTLFFVGVALSAAGISPLATQSAQVGPYQLILSFYSLPRVGQQLNMTIEPKTASMHLQFSGAVLNPAPKTDAVPAKVTLGAESDTPGVYDVTVTPSVRGQWLLHLTVSGPSGPFVGNIPIDVLGPPAMPTWLGWLIGLLPLPVILIFVWSQIRWRALKGQAKGD
jgi:hypothetical protein